MEDQSNKSRIHEQVNYFNDLLSLLVGFLACFKDLIISMEDQSIYTYHFLIVVGVPQGLILGPLLSSMYVY